MEQYLEKIRWNLYCNKQEINISIRFLIILGVLAIFSFFLFKQKWIIFVGAIIAVLIFLHIVHISVVKNKTQKKILQILERDIKFFEKQKLKYKQLQKEIAEKRKGKKSYKTKEPDWLSKKISWIERNIQENKAWIEKFKNLGWGYLDLKKQERF